MKYEAKCEGLLNVAEEFADDYAGGTAPAYAEEQLMENINDLPAGSSLSGVSKMLVKQAERQWKKENQKVSYERYQELDFKIWC